jgi:hypothetical protein
VWQLRLGVQNTIYEQRLHCTGACSTTQPKVQCSSNQQCVYDLPVRHRHAPTWHTCDLTWNINCYAPAVQQCISLHLARADTCTCAPCRVAGVAEKAAEPPAGPSPADHSGQPGLTPSSSSSRRQCRQQWRVRSQSQPAAAGSYGLGCGRPGACERHDWGVLCTGAALCRWVPSCDVCVGR